MDLREAQDEAAGLMADESSAPKRPKSSAAQSSQDLPQRRSPPCTTSKQSASSSFTWSASGTNPTFRRYTPWTAPTTPESKQRSQRHDRTEHWPETSTRCLRQGEAPGAEDHRDFDGEAHRQLGGFCLNERYVGGGLPA